MDQSQSQELVAGLGMLTVALVVIAIMLVPAIFYLLTLQKTLNRCSPECRAMNPGMVWLMLIPLFNVVWQFFVVIKIAKSLGAEFQKRGLAKDPNPGQTLGLVCWILYWVKIAGYSGRIAAPPAAVAA